MATKTSSKSATRKPAPKAFGAGRKTTAPQKPVDVTAKAKVAKKGPAAASEPTASGKELKSEPEKAGISDYN